MTFSLYFVLSIKQTLRALLKEFWLKLMLIVFQLEQIIRVRRSVARRLKHQSPRPYQRQNATFECDTVGKFTTPNRIKINVKKFSRIKHTVASKFAFSSLSMEPLLVSPIKPILGLSMTLIQNCTNNARKVERFFQRIKNYRHISTLFDNLAECFTNNP